MAKSGNNDLKTRFGPSDRERSRREQPPQPEEQQQGGNRQPKLEKRRDAHEGKMTEMEFQARLQKLNEKDSNLVLFFGDLGSSKTTVLTAISDYVRKNYLFHENGDNSTGNQFVSSARERLKNKVFPQVTPLEKLTEYEIAIRKSSGDEWTNLTFVEMSGEHSRQVSNRFNSKPTREFQLYLAENNLPLVILIIVGYDELVGNIDHEDIEDQDELIADFINNLRTQNVDYQNMALIVSKYDRDKPNLEPLENIAKERLRSAFTQIQGEGVYFKVFPFSVGKVRRNPITQVDEIENYNLSDCSPIVDWILKEFEPPPVPPKPKWKFW